MLSLWRGLLVRSRTQFLPSGGKDFPRNSGYQMLDAEALRVEEMLEKKVVLKYKQHKSLIWSKL